MNFRFLPEAEEDYQEAFDYYDAIDPALADRFAQKIDAAIADALHQPLLRPVMSDNIRRCLVEVFPYGVYYTFDGDLITIVAVMHQSRNPLRWKRRK